MLLYEIKDNKAFFQWWLIISRVINSNNKHKSMYVVICFNTGGV